MGERKAAADDLRRRAERQLSEQGGGESGSEMNMQRLLHELQVHQIELESQNEHLREAQLALELARARYFDLYDLAPVGYCTVDERGIIEEGNLTLATLLGFARGALIMQRFQHFVARNSLATFTLCSNRLLESGEAQSLELQMVRGDGTQFWGQLSITAVPDASGRMHLRIALNDVSERKRVEDALREQKEFSHLIAENIADFIAILDLEGRRLYNSPSYAKFVGNPRALIGSDSFADVHPEDRERVRQAFRETVASGIGQSLEYRFVMADGSFRSLESRGSVIRDSDGRIARVLVVSHDITERQRLEAEIRQLAFQDPLTKLPNRRLLQDRLTQTMAASKRSGCYSALMFLDLDNFKQLNDTGGHELGDALLIEAAARLSACVRETDTVARFGGDEFLVMISELAEDRDESDLQAGLVAEKIRSALAEPYTLTFRRADGAEIRIEHRCTASIGVALFINHELSESQILKRADSAMYDAKSSGRNSFRFYQERV
ncbi:diguanylate cyclase domain-containing protein [Rhodocyclus tenuis]|uniref:diguanylate cyclase domain-containing protein n=1 Tax=Rhodocyclus tenuis TaxID=1066 RepID=UPI0019076D9C|nr:diguanylate cyclase [Rhodocyclus tenuis]MBK1679758.1 hypothetical protein [Rhodocyclus tenuis]